MATKKSDAATPKTPRGKKKVETETPAPVTEAPAPETTVKTEGEGQDLQKWDGETKTEPTEMVHVPTEDRSRVLIDLLAKEGVEVDLLRLAAEDEKARSAYAFRQIAKFQSDSVTHLEGARDRLYRANLARIGQAACLIAIRPDKGEDRVGWYSEQGREMMGGMNAQNVADWIFVFNTIRAATIEGVTSWEWVVSEGRGKTKTVKPATLDLAGLLHLPLNDILKCLRAAKKAKKAASEGTESGEGAEVNAIEVTDPASLIQNEDKETKKRQDAAIKRIKSGIEDLFAVGLTKAQIVEMLATLANYQEPPPAEPAPTSTGEAPETSEEG